MSDYTILEKIGEGGMGQVYRAMQTHLRRPVALKTIVSDLADDPQILQRFRREVKLLCALSHPHIVPVFDSGVMGNKPYFVMELVVGRAVDQYVREGGPPPLARTALLLSQLADAVSYLHAKGIQHRDIKSKNLILTERDGADHLVLVDFGLARTSGSRGLTKMGEMVGTLAYLSPEVIDGESVGDPRDVWAIGVVACELLTGRPLFSDPNPVALASAVVSFDPASLPRTLDGAPAWILELVKRCLQLDPAKRITARDLHQALEAHREDIPGEAVAAEAGPSPPAIEGDVRGLVASSMGFRTGPRLRLPARGRAAIGVALFGLLLALGVTFRRPAEEPKVQADAVSPSVTSVTEAAPLGRKILWRTLHCLTTDRSAVVDFELPGRTDLVVNVRGWKVPGEGRDYPAPGSEKFFHQVVAGLRSEALYQVSIRTAGGEVLLDGFPIRTQDAGFRSTQEGFLRAINEEGYSDMTLDFLSSRPDPELAPKIEAMLVQRPVEQLSPGLYSRVIVALHDRNLMRLLLARIPTPADAVHRLGLFEAQSDLGVLDHLDVARDVVLHDKDKMVAIGAARVLGRDRSPESGRVIASLIETGTWRNDLIPGLVDCDREGARRRCEAWLGNPDPEGPSLGLVGALGLAELGEPRDAATLARILRTKATARIDEWVAPVLGDLGGPVAREALVERRPGADAPCVEWAAARAGAPALTTPGGPAPAESAIEIARSGARGLLGDPPAFMREEARSRLTGEPSWHRDLATWLTGMWREQAAIPRLEGRATKPGEDPYGLAAWSLFRMGADKVPAGVVDLWLTEVTGDDPAKAVRQCVLLVAAHGCDPGRAKPKLELLAGASATCVPVRDLCRILLGRHGIAGAKARFVPLIPLVHYQPLGLELREGEVLHARGWGIHTHADRPEGWAFFRFDANPVAPETPYTLILRSGRQEWNVDSRWRSFIAEKPGTVLFSPIRRHPVKMELPIERLMHGLVVIEILEK